MNILEVRDLSVAFPHKGGTKKILEDISFELKKGEVLGLVGESGSGKSMTASAVARLLPKRVVVEKGEVIFDGKDLLQISEKEMRKNYRAKRISTLFQDAKGTFSPVTPVGPQIAEMLILHRDVRAKKAKEEAVKLLAEANISKPEESYEKIIGRLSGGEAQRASIAMMALSTKPDLLIADEATTALDVTVQKKTLDYLMSVVREKGISLLFITHDFGLVAEYADKVVVLDKGRLVETGVVDEVFYSPKSEFMQRVLNDLPSFDRPLRQPRRQEEFSEAVIDVDKVSVEFARKKRSGFFKKTTSVFTAVDNVDLTLKKGEILGIAGESGSGKTTLMRAVLGSGIIPESARVSGSVRVLGQDMHSLSEKELRSMRKTVGGVPQSSSQSITPGLRVGYVVGEGLDIHGLYESKDYVNREAEREKRVAELLDSVGLSADFAGRFTRLLSGGEQQRVAIASALATDPEILILDEPTASLDASRKNTILRLLLKLHEERDLSYIMISHELPALASVCDRVAVMYKGRIVEMGTPSQVFGNPQHPYTKRLVNSVPIPDPQKARDRGQDFPDLDRYYDVTDTVLVERLEGHFVAEHKI